MKIAILTARGGSKRVPRKNIKEFMGKPMIAWPIAAALESGCFEHVFVSTEDEEIARIATTYGAEVPYLRSIELADDYTHAHVPAKEMLEWAMAKYDAIEAFCHIYPAAPFLRAEDIISGCSAIEKGAPNAYGMMEVPFPVYQVTVKDGDGLRPLFEKEKFGLRSQDVPPMYIDVGQMYWFTTEYFLAHETAICDKTVPIEIPRERCIDIDTEEDWAFAEKMAKLLEG